MDGHVGSVTLNSGMTISIPVPSASCAEALEQEGWPAHEEKALLEMAALGKRIRRQQDRQVDVASPEGRDAACSLLRCVHRVGFTVGVQLAPRVYRYSTPADTIAQFLDPEAFYSIQLLVVSCQHWRSVALNDRVFSLSQETMALSLRLCRSFTKIGLLLKDIRGQGPAAIPRSAVAAILEAFDHAWAAFEQKLFMELHVMQMASEPPLAPLVRATERLRNLCSICQQFDLTAHEEGIEEDPEYQEQRSLLVDAISRLNFVANPHNNQNVYGAGTLDEFEAMIYECVAGRQDPQEPSSSLATDSEGSFSDWCADPHRQELSLPLAADAVGSFNDVCAYLHKLESCLDSVDPCLSNNKVLVEKLARWDATWDRAILHALDPAGRHALETLVGSVREAQVLSPELVEMCDECSAEMFLVLPRLLWLCFLASPRDLSMEVMDLVPHHFVQTQNGDGDAEWHPGESLQELHAEYARTMDIIASAVAGDAEESRRRAMPLGVELEEAKMEVAAQLLARSAVMGIRGDLEKHAAFLSPGPDGIAAREACEAFMRGLESWSIELQRTSAREWNSLANVVVRCLTASPLQLGEAAETFEG